jgi:hypothetical protein
MGAVMFDPTPEEQCLMIRLLMAERKTLLNNRQQSKNPDKEFIYIYQATVIDKLLDKFKKQP